MTTKHVKYQSEASFMDVKLSKIWYLFEDKSESMQITIEPTRKRPDLYNITVSYIEK